MSKIFKPVYKEDRGDSYYFRDEDGEALVAQKGSELANQLLESYAAEPAKEPEGYSSMSYQELLKEAERRGLQVPNKTKKVDLIKMLEEMDKAPATPASDGNPDSDDKPNTPANDQ